MQSTKVIFQTFIPNFVAHILDRNFTDKLFSSKSLDTPLHKCATLLAATTPGSVLFTFEKLSATYYRAQSKEAK